MFKKITLILSALFFSNGAHAGENSLSEGVSFFVGQFSASSFPGDANIPFAGDLESNYNFGMIYNRDLVELGHGFFWGGEVGGAIRLGDNQPTSAEIWAGATIRHQGLDIGFVNVAPRFTFGLSAVTDTIGIETKRAHAAGTDAALLFYLGPEIAFSFEQLPKTEFFYRTHHRSGANGTLSNMSGGHNAHVFGVRRNF
ncbi:hypothetical protein WNY59_13440 [Ahrensia kielensis]|uniref:Acyloxyacyl hydrolase n=1 Tax=Ahrensia kielensis TaxID=76980 RepID=A0ABU9T8Y1_9HYPH